MHPRSQCPAYLNQTICQQCYLPGHLKSHCRSIVVDDSTICKCCGEKGTYQNRLSQKYRSMRTMQCTGSHGQCMQPSTGICTQGKPSLEVAAAASPCGSKTAGAWRSTSLRNMWARQRPRIQMDCENCGGLVIDDGDSATKSRDVQLQIEKKRGATQRRHPKASCQKMKASCDQTLQPLQYVRLFPYEDRIRADQWHFRRSTRGLGARPGPVRILG